MTLASAVVKTLGLAYLANKVASSSFPVTDIAQVSCYDPTGPVLQRCEGTGQDGDYERLAQSYCEPQSGIVLDRTTGLVWTKAVVGPFSFAEALNSPPSTGGYTDWRLPTMKELYSLMDFNGSTGMTELDNVPYVNGIFEIAHGTTRFIYGQLWSTNTYTSTVFEGTVCQFGLNPIDGRIECEYHQECLSQCLTRIFHS